MISYKLSIGFEFGLSTKQSRIVMLFSLSHSFVDFAARRKTRRCLIIYSLYWNLSLMRDNVIIYDILDIRYCWSRKLWLSLTTATTPHKFRELRYCWSRKLWLYLSCGFIYTQGGRRFPNGNTDLFLFIYEHDLLQLISRTASTDEKHNFYLF